MTEGLRRAVGGMSRSFRSVIPAFFAGIFIFGLLFAPGVHAATSVSGNVSGTWNAAGSPYVVSSATILSGQTLVVEAGTIVKFVSTNSSLTVNGTLLVNGTPSSKVTFTSFADDSVGGDTNGNGAATSGAAGQWGSVFFNSGSGTISNLDIRYAGGGANIPQYTIGVSAGSSVSLTGSDISSSSGGNLINQSGGTLSVTGSYLHDMNPGTAVSSTAGTLALHDNTYSNLSAASVGPSVNFTHAGNTALQAKGGFFSIQSGTLAQNQTWNADLPYLVSALTVPAGVTLTVGEGAILKFASTNSSLTVNGTLNVTGTYANKAYFTSFADDSVGGDSNGNGAATTGASGQWGSLVFGGSSSENSVSGAVIRYAGGGANFPQYGIGISIPAANTVAFIDSDISRNASNGIYVFNGTLSVTGTDVHDHPSATGLNVPAGTVTVSDSSFHANAVAINRSAGTPSVDARNNWWGSVSGPRSSSTPSATGDFVSANVTYAPWLNYDPTDHVAPLVSITAGSTGTVSETLASFEFSSTDPTATFLCRLDTPTVNGAYLPCTSPQAYADLVDGAHAFYVVATDLAGNSSEAVREWTVQTVPPTPTLSDLGQSKVQGTTATPVEEGGMISENILRISANLFSPLGRQVKLQVEAKKTFEEFDGATSIVESGFVASDSDAAVDLDMTLVRSTETEPGKKHGPYQWRARAVDAQGVASEWVEFGTPGNKDFQRAFKVAVVLADLADTSIQPPTLASLSQPCVLPSKDQNATYVTGGWSAYVGDMFDCVNDYYRENSFGTVAYDISVIDNGGSWVALSGYENQYAGREPVAYQGMQDDARLAALGIGHDVSDAEIVMVIHDGRSQSTIPSGPIQNVGFVQVGIRSSSVNASVHTGLGVWVHELVHATSPWLGFGNGNVVFPDLYEQGSIGRWDVMAKGASNGDYRNPSSLSAYSRALLGFFGDNLIIGTGNVWVNSVETSSKGERQPAYILDDAQLQPNYLLLESRTKDSTYSVWNASLPEDRRLVLYYANPSKHRITIPGNGDFQNLVGVQDGILNPASQDEYVDFDNGLVIQALQDQVTVDGKYRIEANIRQFTAADWITYASNGLTGVVIDPLDLLRGVLTVNEQRGFANGLRVDVGGASAAAIEAPVRIFPTGLLFGLALVSLLVCVFTALVLIFAANMRKGRMLSDKGQLVMTKIVVLSVVMTSILALLGLVSMLLPSYIGGFNRLWPFTSVQFADGVNESSPALDLHVFCPDGRHVGMNYQTGQYENQLVDAISNGKNIGAPSWIFFPAIPENDGCKHLVSAHDNEAFLAANPEIAAQIPDTSDAYDIYARYIDPASGIHTSETLVNQAIAPGESVVHEISGTTEVVLAAGVPDVTPPATIFSASGTSGENGWYRGPVTASLSASDESGGTGLRETKYSLDSGATWLSYAAPFAIEGEGAHLVLFASTDNAGNAEAANSVVVMIDSVAPVATITGPLNAAVIATSPTSVFGTIEDATSGAGTVTANGVGCVLVEPDRITFVCEGVPLSEAENQVVVTVTDFAGNSSEAAVTITLDSTAPAVASSAMMPAGAGWSSVELSVRVTDIVGAETAVATFTGPSPSTASVGSLTIFRTSGNATDGDWAGRFDFPPASEAPDGAYAVSVRVTDSVGNAREEAIGSVNLDRTGSDIAAVTATPQTQRPGQTVTVALSAKDESSGIVSVMVEDVTASGAAHSMALVGGSPAPGEFGSWSYDLVASLPEGEHALRITVTDGSGNVATQPLSFTVDATAPDTTIDSAPSGLGGTTTVVAFHASEESEFSCQLDTNTWEPCENPSTLANLAGGSHAFRVRATDLAGNAGPIASASWDVDAIAPTVTIDSVTSESTSPDASIAFHADDTSVTFECALDSGVWEPCVSPKAYQGLSVGTHVAAIRATDLAGNVGVQKNARLSVLGTLTFHAVADTYLRNGVPNENNGSEAFLRIRASGDNRGLIRFDAAAIAASMGSGASVARAELRFKVTTNGNNWGTAGKTVDIHRMASPWAEAGATWQCSDDADLSNAKPDCTSGGWDMRKNATANPWSPQPTATALVTNGLAGTVPFDVTSDLAAFMGGIRNDGWLVKKTDENHQGLVEFGSKESGANQPVLVVTYRVE